MLARVDLASHPCYRTPCARVEQKSCPCFDLISSVTISTYQGFVCEQVVHLQLDSAMPSSKHVRFDLISPTFQRVGYARWGWLCMLARLHSVSPHLPYRTSGGPRRPLDLKPASASGAPAPASGLPLLPPRPGLTATQPAS